MFTELIIFAAFYAVAIIAHALHKPGVPGVAAHRFAVIAAVIVKASATAFHEYAVHFVVYSGYVIRSH